MSLSVTRISKSLILSTVPDSIPEPLSWTVMIKDALPVSISTATSGLLEVASAASTALSSNSFKATAKFSFGWPV